MSFLKYGSMLFAVSVVIAFLGYLYHLLMGRMLGPAEYGELASLFTFIYLFAAPTGLTGAIQLSAAREISQIKTGNRDMLLCYVHFLSGKVFLLAISLLIIFLLLSPLISAFLQIGLIPIGSLAVLLFFYLLLVIPWGLLQGLQGFALYGISNLLMTTVKLFFALALVSLGFGVGGAITGVTAGAVVAGAFCLFFLKDFFKKPAGQTNVANYRFFSLSIMLSLFFLMFLINVDILLVKHFFSAEEAGQYSIASLLGKLVYFLSISFATVLLPMVSGAVDRKKEFALLKKSFFYISCFAVVLLFAFWFFPKQIVSIFFGAAYAPSALLLPLFGIAMSLFSYCNVLVYFEIALKRNSQVFALAFSCIFETIALWFFHASLEQVLVVLTITNALLAAALLLNLFVRERE